MFVGAGYAGVEALAELSDLVEDAIRFYPGLHAAPRRWVLVDAAPKILPEIPSRLGEYAARELTERGVEIHVGTTLESVSDRDVVLAGGTLIPTGTLVWTAGVTANPLVRQLGLPQEVYNDPADTFVAGFLGSPPMNFFERNGALVGFRPEQMLPKAAYSTQEPLVHVWFRVDRVENLGADRLLYGSLRDLAPEVKMIINLPFTVHLPITEGQAYEFSVKERDLKFFDKESGLRIAPRPL